MRGKLVSVNPLKERDWHHAACQTAMIVPAAEVVILMRPRSPRVPFYATGHHWFDLSLRSSRRPQGVVVRLHVTLGIADWTTAWTSTRSFTRTHEVRLPRVSRLPS